MKLLPTKRLEFYGNQAQQNASNPKIIFGMVNKLLHRESETPLSQHVSLDVLAENFSSFFANKICAALQLASRVIGHPRDHRS